MTIWSAIAIGCGIGLVVSVGSFAFERLVARLGRRRSETIHDRQSTSERGIR